MTEAAPPYGGQNAIQSWPPAEAGSAAENGPADRGQTGLKSWPPVDFGQSGIYYGQSGMDSGPADGGQAAMERWPAGGERRSGMDSGPPDRGQIAIKSWPPVGGDGKGMEPGPAADTEQFSAEPPRLFLSFDEKKTPVPKQLKRPAYSIHFYLRDNKGKDVLAVTGDDQGVMVHFVDGNH
jgi:hypothetical protein